MTKYKLAVRLPHFSPLAIVDPAAERNRRRLVRYAAIEPEERAGPPDVARLLDLIGTARGTRNRDPVIINKIHWDLARMARVALAMQAMTY